MLSLRNIVPLLLSVIFLSAGGFYHISHKSNFTEASVSTDVTCNLKEEFEQVEIEAGQLLKLGIYEKAWLTTQHSFLLIDSSGVVAWSKHEFLPDLRLLQEPFKYKLLQLSRGNFLIRKWKVDEGSFLICIIILNERFKVSNQYLREKWNHTLFSIDGVEIFSPSNSLGAKICLDEFTCLFNIRLDTQADNYPDDWASIILILVGLVLLLLGLFNLLATIHKKGYYDLVFIAAVLFLYVIRISLIEVGFPIQWGQLDLFDPQKFASSSFNVSLGDFVANSIVVVVCCTYLILNYSKFKCIKWISKSSDGVRFIFGCISLLITLFSFLFPFLFFELVFHNSNISVDITNQVHFDLYRVFAYLAVVLGTISSFFFCHVFIRIAIGASTKRRTRFLITLLIAVLFFILYCIVEKHDYTITLGIAILYILVIYFSDLHHSLNEISFTTFLYLLVAIIAYASQGALSIRIFNKEARFAAQFRFANSNLINQDNLGEYLLSENVKRIAQDAFIQLRLTNPFLPKQAIRQRINQRYLSSYFDRYESEIYLYNANGAAVNMIPTSNMFSTIGLIQENAIETDYENVYMITDHVLKSTRHYAGIVPIKRSNVLVGYIVLDLSLKRIVPQNVYPELLVDNRFSQFLGSKDFSFAIYTHDSISNRFGNFNYEKSFDYKLLHNPILFSIGISEHGLQHTAVHGDSGEVAVVTANSYPFFYVVVNFAFLTIVGLAILLIWIFGYSIQIFFKGSRLNYSARIQLYVYLAFILPLIIVMVSTLSLTSKANETKLLEDAQLKAEQTGDGVVSLMNNTSSDTLTLSSTLEINLNEFAKSNNVDINVFSSKGLLIASSQPTIYENLLTSVIMNRQAFQRLVHDKDSYVVEREDIGTLQYNSSYLAIKSPVTGKLNAILNIPFFKSADTFEKSQALVLGNIMVIFVGVFILFSLLSFYAVNWLTFPLRLITKRLSKTTLTGENQPLLWETQDEIGLMVKEYNHMLAKFERSKLELARNQKESAWREMAQQVAHEIKNPLTPMKLTLQQMEQTVRGDEKKYQAVKMLLTQVEILNDIASSFSTFAKMPSPQLARLNLAQVLKSTINLYANHSAGNVTLVDSVDAVFVLGDDQLLNRVFSNLILNALQAGNDSEKTLVEVRLMVIDKKCRILIKDNGRGVDTMDHERIFMPYFSTKKIGSGLGLAIAKQGIEQCGGRIWFESELGKGTSFWIELDQAL